MNRRQRRAAEKQAPTRASVFGDLRDPVLTDLFERAIEQHARGELGAAANLYKKLLALRPDHSLARERLALVYRAQGNPEKASAQYAELARIIPQSVRQFSKALDTLKELLPDLAAALAAPSSPAQASLAETGTLAIAANPYLRVILELTPVRDLSLERWLTSLRANILRAAVDGTAPPGDNFVAFCCSLARQCFVNEYVFATEPDELTSVEKLKGAIANAIARGLKLNATLVVTLAMYEALHQLPEADALAARTWPADVDAVIEQQIREPREEIRIRDQIPRLTAISGGVTAQVRAQYEDNPYPRWVRMGPPPSPLRVFDNYIRFLFPTVAFRPTGAQEELDVLVAGCGTGRNALDIAQGYAGARVLGVDLSLASLANARRKTPPAVSGAIEFAQGDILSLGSIERRFDMIVVGGVLHHMLDPLAGWRELIKLMKPDGLMQVGLYSEHARKDIVAARAMIAERGYGATADDIRRCRHDLIFGGTRYKFMELDDFFTVSECRDLLFHVHEQRFTIPEIKTFLAENDLKFIGFEFSPPEAHAHYRALFAKSGWSFSDLDRWDAFERENPDVFAAMYVFWVQKN